MSGPDYKERAIAELKNYEINKAAVATMTARINAVDARINAPRTASCSAAPIHGGGNRFEETVIDGITDKDEIKQTLKAIKAAVTMVNTALKSLDPEERTILFDFYIHRKEGYIAELKDKLSYERSSVYNLKDRALKKFIYLLYGVKT